MARAPELRESVEQGISDALATDCADFFDGNAYGDAISADTQTQPDLALLRKWRESGAQVTLNSLNRIGNSEVSLLATKASEPLNRPRH